MKKSNTKRSLKKEYIPLLLAILVLIVLVLVLVIVLFYKDDKGLIVPELPNKESIVVGMFDFDSGKYDPSKLDLKDTNRSKVDYKVITDYYKSGILMTNSTVKHIGNEFIIKSGIYATDPYVSIVDEKGDLKWVSKIDIKDYDKISVVDVLKKDNAYHIFAYGIKQNKKDNMVIKLDSKGNEEKRETISKDSDNSISNVLSTDEGFVIITDGRNNIELYYLSNDYKMLKNPFLLKNSKNNRFKTYTPEVMGATVKNGIVTMVVSYVGSSEETNYLVKYDLNKGEVIISNFYELDKISSPYTEKIDSYDDKFYTIKNNIAYLFSSDGSLISKYDYTSVVLGKFDNCEVSEETPNCDDQIWINSYYTNDNGDFIVSGMTLSETMVTDVFDKNMKLKKRLTHEENVHDGTENIYISSAYINEKMYEFYSFGIDTPSIMISIIG